MNYEISQKIREISKKWLKLRLTSLALLAILMFLNFPHLAFSQVLSNIGQGKMYGPIAPTVIRAYYSEPTLPKISQREPNRTMFITITAYNSEPGQTDSTPFITAFNTHVRDGIVATNFLPKGTLVRFPDLYGDKVFVVEDRMNKRYFYHMDIWMADKQEAKQFGVKYQKMEIL